ncbi:MAG: aminoacyl-tRNA hydrolase, partial [Patescibacteria group bacterium]|nr:aminoacyl-tRNA hydrolase [Patescibacteria group bacterium]
MRIIIGLGNPGEKYKTTRHNAGFMTLDYLAEKKGQAWLFNKKFNAKIIKSNDLLLAKPQTFMNNSGQAVQAIMSFYKLLPKKLKMLTAKNSDLADTLTVIHDDIDIELGKTKTAVNSGSAGHNGINSIISHLKTKNLKRIRIGIKTDQTNKMPVEKFVLQKFNDEEKKTID